MDNLCCEIERLRQRMHITARNKGIAHPDVLMVSQKLDVMINEFYKRYLANKNVRDNGCLKLQMENTNHLEKSETNCPCHDILNLFIEP